MTTNPEGTVKNKPVDASVSTSGHDEEARLKLELQKLGLEIKGLRYGTVLEWAKAISGPVAVLGLMVSLFLGQDQLRIATEARLEDRFQKEVAHLGSASSAERLTGVAGLSLIIEDSSESRRHREAVSFLVNSLSVEQDAVVRGALVSALLQLSPKHPGQASLVAVALDLLVDRNRVLTGLHEFSADELTIEGIEESARAGPIVASGKVLAGLIRKGARPKNTNMTGIACVGCDLSGSGVDLRGYDLSRSILANVNFSYASLESATLTDVILTGARFVGANLRRTHLEGSGDVSRRYSKLELLSALTEVNDNAFPDFSGADLRHADFGNRVLAGKRWDEDGDAFDRAAKFIGADLEGADLTKFYFTYLDQTPRYRFSQGSWRFWGTCLPTSQVDDKATSMNNIDIS